MSKTFSFEFFPPKTLEGREKLQATCRTLAALGPRFFSVTFGAGGSTQAGTLDTALALRDATGVEVAPHLSCIGASRERIRDILGDYHGEGIRRMVALRGDFPSGMVERGDFHYANELVAFIREEQGDDLHIEVAAYPETHPESGSAEADLAHFKRKAAGANGAITQYFYNGDAYLRFVDRCRGAGISIPIIPGIMPITSFEPLVRFSERCGAEIPRWLRMRLSDFGDDEAGLRAFGVDVMSDLCRRLLEAGAPGLHFYVLNRAEPATTIWRNLGLSNL